MRWNNNRIIEIMATTWGNVSIICLSSLMDRRTVGLGPHCFFWKSIWKLKNLSKIWVFAWQLGDELLPTNVKITSMHQNVIDVAVISYSKEEKPLKGTVKINFDADVSKTKIGFGVIARDSQGFVIGGGYGFKNEEMMGD
ncbi:hypothetical protein Goshw_005229 [Gossypium schwendimanii]|uniref:RNase H type-1 domain-containing protein n=1 Tax=Gossypium schwendimanii TaxID=34291 RepID=A0A7J9L8S3_GOSSC|nr:hypothetical protein [Gossypium schwendimanii]